jgi:hypothetical protein
VLNDNSVGLLKQHLGSRRLQSNQKWKRLFLNIANTRSLTSTATEYLADANLEEMHQFSSRWVKNSHNLVK